MHDIYIYTYTLYNIYIRILVDNDDVNQESPTYQTAQIHFGQCLGDWDGQFATQTINNEMP